MLLDIELLGVPHLGRTFRNKVPLHRRGEREAMIWQRFEEAIRSAETATHGDLFDGPLVSFDALWRAALAYWAAPEATRFVVLQGNHDASRDLGVRPVRGDRDQRVSTRSVTAVIPSTASRIGHLPCDFPHPPLVPSRREHLLS